MFRHAPAPWRRNRSDIRLTPHVPSKKLNVPFGEFILVASIVYLVMLATRYDLCFQNSETVIDFLPRALTNGSGFSLKDFGFSLDAWDLDGDSRPRFVSYLAYILALKTRLALWRFIPPHPSFSPFWLLTLVLGPVLLFKFLKIELADRQAALVGVAMYLMSPGVGGGVTMLFHQGKPLANVIVIATFWLSSLIHRDIKPRQHGELRKLLFGSYYLWLFTVLVITPFIEETAVFAYFIPIVWCPSLFWPSSLSWRDIRDRLINWAAIAAPAVCAVACVLWLAPLATMTTVGKRFDVLSYLARLVQWDRASITYIFWQAYNLLSAAVVPWSFDGTPVPVRWPVTGGNRIEIQTGTAALSIVTIVLGSWAVAGQKASRPYVKLAILAGIFVLFQSIQLLFHPLLLVAPGFYYGAIFSVLFSVWIAIVFSALSQRPTWPAQLMAGVAVLYLGAASIINFQALNKSWMRHENYIALNEMHKLPFYDHVGDWTQLKRLHEKLPPYYSSDSPPSPSESPFGEAIKIWQRWRHGERDLLDEDAVRVRELWIVRELMAEH